MSTVALAVSRYQWTFLGADGITFYSLTGAACILFSAALIALGGGGGGGGKVAASPAPTPLPEFKEAHSEPIRRQRTVSE